MKICIKLLPEAQLWARVQEATVNQPGFQSHRLKVLVGKRDN
jgi:hypothetical protein